MVSRNGRMGYTGSNTSKLAQLIQDIGYNKDVDIMLGTVTASPPQIKVRLDDSPIEFEKDDLIIAGKVFVGDPLQVGDRVIVACMDDKMQYVVLDKAYRY